MTNDKDFDFGFDGSTADDLDNNESNNLEPDQTNMEGENQVTDVIESEADLNPEDFTIDSPDLSEQELVTQIFAESGMKVSTDDPMVQLLHAVLIINSKNANDVSNALVQNAQKISQTMATKQEAVNDTFDDKLVELKDLLTKLEQQKEAIVIDVWRKLEQRVMEKIKNDLTGSIQKIAENSNNKVNNERLLIKGGAGGLIIGIIICAVILFIFK